MGWQNALVGHILTWAIYSYFHALLLSMECSPQSTALVVKNSRGSDTPYLMEVYQHADIPICKLILKN